MILPSATWGKSLDSSFLIVIHRKLDGTEEAFLAANCQENRFYLSAGWYETDNFLFKVQDTGPYYSPKTQINMFLLSFVVMVVVCLFCHKLVIWKEKLFIYKNILSILVFMLLLANLSRSPVVCLLNTGSVSISIFVI